MRECGSPTRRFPPFGRWLVALVLSSVLLVGIVSLAMMGALKLAGRDPVRTVANLRHVFLPRPGRKDSTRPDIGQAAREAAAAKEAARKAETLLASARDLEKEGKFRESLNALKELLGSIEPTADMRVSVARIALRALDRQEARFQLQEAIRLDPENRAAVSLMARLQYAEFRFNDALVMARRLVELDPEGVPGQVLVCRCLRELGKTEAAAAAARDLFTSHPDDSTVELVLADLLADQRQWQEAERHYQAILKRDPEHIGAALGLAKVYQRQERESDAEAILAQLRERMAQQGPAPPGLGVYERGVVEAERQSGTEESRLWVAEGHMDTARLAEAMARYAETQLSHGDQAAAVETYRRLTARYPTLYQSRGRLAELLIREGKMDEAYQVATKLIADHPHDVGADIALGTILHSRGLSSMAETFCQDALASKDPRAGAVHALYGRMAMAKGDPKRAAQQFRLAIERQPTDPAAPIQLARCLTAQGEMEKAIQVLWEAVERQPASVSLQLELGQLYVATNRFDEALKRYRIASTVEPVSPAALSNLGLLLLKKGEVDEAFATLQNARTLFPQNPIIAQSLAVVQTCKGDFRGAVENLRFAVERVPGKLDFQYDLAVALQHAGENAEACMVLQRALGAGRDFRRRDDATKLLAKLSPKKQAK
jgi:tetratricopeptide (TPR) repeat protein